MPLRRNLRLLRLAVVSELRGPGLRLLGGFAAAAAAAFGWSQGPNPAGGALVLGAWLGTFYGMGACLWFAYAALRDQNEKQGAVIRSKPVDGAYWVTLLWAGGLSTWFLLMAVAFLAAALAQVPQAGPRSLIAYAAGFVRAAWVLGAMATLSFGLSRMMRSPLGGILVLFAWFCALAGLNYIPVYLRPDYSQNLVLFSSAALFVLFITGSLVERFRRGELRRPLTAGVGILAFGFVVGRAAVAARERAPERIMERSVVFQSIAQQDLQEGARAPGFWLPDGKGGRIRTRDYAGRILLIYLFSARDSRTLRLLDTLDQVAREYGSRGVQPIGVCLSQDQGDGPALVRAGGYRFPIGVDPTTSAVAPHASSSLAAAYRAENLPVLVVTDRRRRVTHVSKLPDQDPAQLRAWIEENLAAESEWHP